MPHRIVFTGQQQVSLEPFELSTPGEHQVRIRAVASLMSTGTENTVFNRLFDPGTHWDNWVKYPFYPGYSHVGIVDALGPGVQSLKLGDVVASRGSHSSHVLQEESRVMPVPEGLDPKLATWFALAKIGAMGARAAQYQMGDSVLIIGAGPIGQMSVRWAFAMGVETIIVVDMVESRLSLARKGGATATIAACIDRAESQILAANHGNRPRVVIDSTGAAPVFAAALRLADCFGRVVLLGDTGSPSRQTLTGDVVTRGLTIAGAYDQHESGSWTLQNITRLFFALVLSGRFNLADLNTRVFRPDDCRESYELVNARRGETMGIVFDWMTRQW